MLIMVALPMPTVTQTVIMCYFVVVITFPMLFLCTGNHFEPPFYMLLVWQEKTHCLFKNLNRTVVSISSTCEKYSHLWHWIFINIATKLLFYPLLFKSTILIKIIIVKTGLSKTDNKQVLSPQGLIYKSKLLSLQTLT